MIQHRHIAIALAVFLVVGTAAPFTGTVAAQEDDGPLGDILGMVGQADENASGLDRAKSVVSSVRAASSGLFERLSYRVKGSDSTAEKRADEFQTYYNDHNASFEDYTNSRTTASTSHDVVALNFTMNDETATRYLVTDVNSSTNDYENSTVVSSTNRTVDQWVTLEGVAADSTPDEAQRFHENYVAEDRDIDGALVSRLGAKYKGHVAGSYEYLPDSIEED